MIDPKESTKKVLSSADELYLMDIHRENVALKGNSEDREWR